MLSHKNVGTIKSFSGDSCVVTFASGDLSVDVQYGAPFIQSGPLRSAPLCFSRLAGSPWLQWPPALLGGTARAQRRDAADEALRAKVQAHAGAVCATSPHQRDVMRRRVAPHLVEEKSALILMMSVYVGGHFD